MASSPNPSSTTSNPTTAIQTRITTHMNADHATTLSLFLQHYAHLPAPLSTPARITNIKLTHIILTSPHGQSYIPLVPPMASFADARPRMVAMHQDALRGLGLSDTKVEVYKPPNTVVQVVVAFLAGISFVSFAHPAVLARLRAFWSLAGTAPWLYDLACVLQPYVIVFMVALHGVEAGWMARTRLRRHRVQGPVWWAWVGSTFVEGVGAFERIDRMVREKEKKQEEGDVNLKH